ncbi:uncharacterized protein LOC118445483 [Vespa mandarinia]|uniref:uncharacterized protein LOC118445483 n=1 Tax=Vespa mandarinia TaxID=7446 RepID=UPI00160E350E|nr:uncharacterized protein LOC118445483 [Vespa mandarinia]XP_035730934.1 uncharacterized protein LOC118445483 [Vespa mandarinia]XP_035730935.1 uncharacterized protein LOC118445483 [Vespa mandarinia]XP_035730937.1 uncharacterized protein LOC118445483 [Vespa mandarinia]XP_035730938.1 uncharacterized protein LOC118445483 [Vespa mandarinia]XP_035730939.1 uncharacterized protein LOC118445483 [Vespa mandarinia]
MVVGEASIHNIMGGMESTGGVRLHNHKRKLKQRFDIIKKLGQGTYGKVQLGINKETGQEVAIKTIKKCKIETEADLIRIRREIQIMSSVQHPNIIHIYEVFENREKMVLVMEYAAGGELYDYLSERKVLSEQEARRIFRQIATAVFYCHKHKICHRDLKLENILLDQIGNAKIADFGLSNVFDEQRLLSTFCGSPLYASPEIVKGTPYHGPEVDCWSLGVLLYTLVYGAMPFDGSNFKRLVKQISQSDYFEPKKPSPASPLIRDMLTACPARRADIEKICSHWWVNEGYEQNCLDIAEDLAAQTPVRLDLLLSLVPQSASAEKLLVGDQQTSGDVANNMSSETLVPTRCHSVGSLMEFDQNNSDRRIRELFEEENRGAAAAAAATDAKRKLETTPSMDETIAATVKKKERSRRKERSDEREPRMYRSTSRHHSAPIPNSIMEETMEVEPTAIVTVPTSKTVDLNKVDAAACLELIEESKEKSPSKERSKTPVPMEHEQLSKEMSAKNIDRFYDTSQNENKESALQETYSKASEESNHQQEIASLEKNKSTHALPNKVASSKELNDTSKINVPNKDNLSNKLEIDNSLRSVSEDMKQIDSMDKEIKKLKERALSLDSELANEVEDVVTKPVERRRSKIFETAEKFNQMTSSLENEKPKKIFIPGVNVGGAKRAFERKASLTSGTSLTPVKHNASKVIIDVDKKSEKIEDKSKLVQASVDTEEKSNKRDEAKKRAIDIISGAIGKPPVLRKVNGSPPTSPQNQESKKIGLKIPVGPNDIRAATVSVSTPTETKFSFDNNSISSDITTPTTCEISNSDNSQAEEPKLSSKMEITLKSATLPRPRKTSKAEITLSGNKIPDTVAFKSEVEAKIDAFPSQKLRTQRSEIAFPVAAVVPQTNRSSSLEPEIKPKVQPRERIIPIQVEPDHQHVQQSPTTPPKPPMPQRSMSQRSGSLSRQSTADSDTDSALGSTIGPEPIRKSPREYIIPIAVEGGGYVTPRSGSVEPESKTGTPTSTNAPRSRFSRPRRMSSLLSDASEDESPFSTLHRDSEDLLQRHMHRLRSSRPSRQPSEHGDSLSSGEDDDDDGFELLTAENLFSTLLSRVRSLTQRLNVDDRGSSSFPSSRLLGRLGVNSPQNFWSHNKPLSRRLSESQFKHSLSRDTDIFGRKDSTSSINPGSPNSPGSHNAPSSRESVFEIGSNTLPRDKVEHEDIEAETVQIRKEAQESLEQNFTPSLARRLSRQFIEQTRQSLPRSSSISCEKYYQSPTRENLSLIDTAEGIKRHSSSTTSDQTEYRSRSADRNIRRTNSLLEAGNKADKLDYRFSRRSISLFDDDDNLLPLPRQVMTLGRKYKEIGRSNSGNTWRDTFSVHRTDKIQEESLEDTSQLPKDVLNNTDNNLDAGSVSECTSVSICNSNTNLVDTTSSISIKSRDTSPADSSSNIIDSGKPSYRMDSSKNFENRLLAAENLIKESKLKNLGPSKFDPNLNSNYKETDKCDKESLSSISDAPNMTISKRRSCIPSLRLRSGSLTRDPCIDSDRRKSFAGSQGTLSNIRALSPEKSILSKFFRGGSSKESDSKDKSQKPKQHRISRFLRPDFFDTPREESRYVKEKEAQKAAENERRKSRFMKKKSENKSAECKQETKPEKELKNEMNSLKKDKFDISSDDKSNKEDNTKLKFERQSSRNSFLHSLEKKLEKFRVTDETPKSSSNGGLLIDQKVRALRENSAPPSDSLFTESNLIKRAISVEDMSSKENSLNSRKSRVSSVLGLFKSSDVKQNSNAIKSQSTIMSKLKKSPPKLVKTDASSTNEDTSSTSKIPMKMVKNDSRLIKKPTEGKKPLDNSITESKKSQYKDKVKEKDTNSKERKMSNEKLLKTSGEDESQIDKSSPTEISVDKEIVKKTNSGKKEDDPKLISNPPETRKVMDNGAAEGNISKREKKVIKTKKNVGSVKKIGTGVTKAEKEENGDKKTSKISKLKEPVQKEEAEGTKKKKIVRVVKKVVKKSSENSDNKSEEKAKVLKSIVKGNTSPKKEKSPEAPAINADYSNERNSDLQNSTKFTTSDSSIQETRTKLKGNLSSVDAISNKSELMASGNNSSKSPDCIQINATDSDVTQTKHTDTRGNRGSLKLDLSKIPQHTFRNTTPKKESPKCELIKPNVNVLSQSPKINETNADISSEKFLDSLSKMTHHATITGNKIIIDKPLRAKDVAELKKEVNECARLIENQIELHNDIVPSNEDIAVRKEDEINAKLHTPLNNIDETEPVNEKDIFKDTTQSTNMNTYADEVTSPADEPDSFDSWSICSADMNHTRADLSSPTSPSYSLFSRGDQGESVIDRIRRRSFYLRFNDRRRPSLTVPPPGITLPSSTLPRKYSSSNSRDRDRSKLNSYPLSNKKLMQRSYSLHNEDIPSYRKSPIDKEKYTDLVSYNTEVKTPTEHYSTFSHSTYDPLRKYLRSPTLELSTAHKRYHSTDFSMDDELGAYRNSSLNSILNNNPVEFYGSRNSSMLPRKYGSTITSTEPKTVEYYEELLSPSNPEYLTVRKSPLSNEYLNRSENGYYNINSIKSKTCIAKTKTESTEEINKELEEQGRITSQCNSESKDMPSTSSDLQSIIHNTE